MYFLEPFEEQWRGYLTHGEALPEIGNENNVQFECQQWALVTDGFTRQNEDQFRRFVYSYPDSRDDAQRGRTCTKTGWWAAGRDIVYFEGKPYIQGYEPQSVGYEIREIHL